MTMTPLAAPPEAQPSMALDSDDAALRTDMLGKPFRLSLLGIGAAMGLFARLAAANGYADLNGGPLMLCAAATSMLVGLCLILTAAQRDRFGPPMVWITVITALSWGVLNWISPPFDESVTVWSKPDQAVLAVVGVGNGLLLAGIIALAFVRRGPTLTVAATMLAGVTMLAANTLALRDQWISVACLVATFGFMLLAWDRTPRREVAFSSPTESPRVSRAALSFVSVALCGTALQLWLSRSSIPRSVPAVVLAIVLVLAAFASLIRVRREIERRETTLSEWTSWMREIRKNDFRAEMQNFESPTVGVDGEAPRQLSFPNLSIPDSAASSGEGLAIPSLFQTSGSVEHDAFDGDTDDLDDIMLPAASPASPAIILPAAEPTAPTPDIILPTADTPGDARAAAADLSLARDDAPTDGAGVFSALLNGVDLAPSTAVPASTPHVVDVADLAALESWLISPTAALRDKPLLVAIEAMSLDEFESLPPEDAAMARDEIGSFLADVMPTADLVSYVDGPYFIVAHPSQADRNLLEMNKAIAKTLKPTDGTFAFLRPGLDASLDDIVNEAVQGLLQARRNQTAASA